MRENKWSLKYLLSDTNLVRDIKTIISFLLAYLVAVISNGLIEGFSPAALISFAVTLGAIGTFFAIKIITNEFTDRGMFDEEQTNEELKSKLNELKNQSSLIEINKAYDVLVKYNAEKLEYFKKIRYEELKTQYELEIKRLESLIEHAKMTKKFKWFNRINKMLLSHLQRRKNKVSKKLANLSTNNIYVKYTPVTLQQLRVADVNENENKYSESQRYNITPQKKVRKQMAISNFIKTFFFVGFQGAAIATITSWSQFFIFLALMTLTLATTALTSYVSTRRYAAMNYTAILEEKIEKLKWLNQTTKTEVK